MEKYYIDPRIIYAILKSKGVENLFHANTVLTAFAFISQNSLLSRHFVEANQLFQTTQKSDPDDKKFNVWDDVFIDGQDLHKRYRRPNFYGPVLFVLRLDMLLSPSMPKFLITKDNPMFWRDSQSWDSRYYSDPNEIRNDFLSGKKLDSRIMFTFRAPDKSIKLSKFLDHIIIDDPAVILSINSVNKNIGKIVEERLKEKLTEHGLKHIPVIMRHKGQGISICSCRFKYTWMSNKNYQEFEKMFRTRPYETVPKA